MGPIHSRSRPFSEGSPSSAAPLQGLQSGGMPQDLWLWKFGMELGGEGFEMIVHDG